MTSGHREQGDLETVTRSLDATIDKLSAHLTELRALITPPR